MPIKEELFTDQMGWNVFVFPPAIESLNGKANFHDKRSGRKTLYTGIPLKNLEATYKKTLGKKMSFGNV